MSTRQPVTATRGKAAALTRPGRGRVLLGVPIALGVAASLAAGGYPLGNSPAAAATRTAFFAPASRTGQAG